MLEHSIFTPERLPTPKEQAAIADFLFEHLDQYGDAQEDIQRCLNYATKQIESFGGMIFVLKDQGQIIGAVVINRTGMGGYIPENILVYIAIHQNYRGEGLGSKLMDLVTEHTTGDIALHVEANNPAKFLYEKYGFTNPYLEMRLKR